MKHFIVKISVFLAVIYVAAWGLDYAISKGLYEMDDYRFITWREITSGDLNANLVVMGNSRALSHFEPWTIDSICGLKSYNLGLGGYPINVESMKYNLYMAHNLPPKYIIQQVDYYTLRMLSAPQQHQSEQFLPLIYDQSIRPELKRIGYTWKDLYIPLYRYWGYQMVIKNGLLEILNLKHYITDPSRQGHHYERGS